MSKATYYAEENGKRRGLSDNEVTNLNSWRNSTFLVLLIGYIGYYLCRGNLSAALPLLSNTFGYTNTELGLIGAYSEGMYALGKFINGPIADKLSGRRIFLIGMSGAILFNIIFGLSSSLTAFIIVWCMARYFLSMGWGGLAKIIGNWYPPERNGTVMGFISISFQFGNVVAGLFAGLLVSLGFGWSDLFFYPAGVLTLILIWSYFCSRNHPKDVIAGTNYGQSLNGKKQVLEFGDQDKVSVREILKKLFGLSIFWKLLLYSFLVHMVRSVFMYWTPKYLTGIGMKDSVAIFSSTVFPLLGCIGTIFIGWYTDHYAKDGNRARIMWIMLSLLTATLFWLAQISSEGESAHMLVVVLLGVSGFLLLAPYSMSAGALTLDIAGSRAAGTCSGMIDGVGYIGGAIATWGVGIISDQYGWSAAIFAIAICAAATTLSAMLMSSDLKKRKLV